MNKKRIKIMKDVIRLGVIGLGARGFGVHKWVLCGIADDVKITYVCDLYEDRAIAGKECVEEVQGHTPEWTTDYRRLVESPNVDAVIIMSSWDNHIPAAIAAMRAGKYVASEVGGAYSIEDCWDLVRAYEETGRHCMFLENCCYGKHELMVLRMVKEGLFGKVVACEGGYHHDLREEVLLGNENRHYRLRNYANRNCENYPTHEIGPIAKVLNLNRGNRMVSLSAMASGSWGLNEYACQHDNIDPKYKTFRFAQGDVISTNIKCAGGELITLNLDTTLPRHYSRGFTVRGTRGAFFELNKSIFLDSKGEQGNEKMDNLTQYLEQYMHPIWEKYFDDCVNSGHDGMDWLVYSAFLDSVRNDTVPPIDTYDMASWMAITPLSETSILQGGAPVDFPDFTRGQWTHRTDFNTGSFSLDIL